MKIVILHLSIFVLVAFSSQFLTLRLDKIVETIGSSARKEKILNEEDIIELWKMYTVIHGGNFPNYNQSIQSFGTVVNEIVRHNLEYMEGLHSYRLGMHRYSHMHPNEFNEMFNGFIKPATRKEGSTLYHPQGFDSRIQAFNWEDQGILNVITDQNTTKTCYAFVAAEALQCMFSLYGSRVMQLSVQQLVDCSEAWGNKGLNGGSMDNCFQYVHDVGGIGQARQYPFTSLKNECSFDRKFALTACDSIVYINEANEQDLMDALINVGPIAVAIDASSSKFMSYRKGVYSNDECSPAKLNHGVLLIGYGVEIIHNITYPYWLIKNSWTFNWGEFGYGKILRNGNNTCGIVSYACYPVVSKANKV